MKKSILMVLSLMLVSATGSAIVIRHDQSDARYRIEPKSIPALVDLPDEGHGTLIAPRWVITAAHAVSMMQMMTSEHFVTINGKRREVSRIVIYPDYASATGPWKQMFQKIKTTNADDFLKQYNAAMASLHDVALLELAEPVTDVQPMPIDRGNAKVGMLIDVYGAGATGNDVTGAPAAESHRTQLRHAQNRLTQVEGPWLRYDFDCSANAPVLAGATAGGDSGGAVTIVVGGRTYLAGVTHGLDGSIDDIKHMQDGSFLMGQCGQRFAAARVSFFKTWIDQTIGAQ